MGNTVAYPSFCFLLLYLAFRDWISRSPGQLQIPHIAKDGLELFILQLPSPGRALGLQVCGPTPALWLVLCELSCPQMCSFQPERDGVLVLILRMQQPPHSCAVFSVLSVISKTNTKVTSCDLSPSVSSLCFVSGRLKDFLSL